MKPLVTIALACAAFAGQALLGGSAAAAEDKWRPNPSSHDHVFFEKLFSGRVLVSRWASARDSVDRGVAIASYFSPDGKRYGCYSKGGSYRKSQNNWRLEPSPKHRTLYDVGGLGKWRYPLFYDGESGRLHREYWGLRTRTWVLNTEGWIQESWPRRLKEACPDLELPASLAINEKQTEARLSRMKAQDRDAVIRNFPGSELRALGANGRRNDKVRVKVTPKGLSAFLLAHDRTVLKAMDGTRYVLVLDPNRDQIWRLKPGSNHIAEVGYMTAGPGVKTLEFQFESGGGNFSYKIGDPFPLLPTGERHAAMRMMDWIIDRGEYVVVPFMDLEAVGFLFEPAGVVKASRKDGGHIEGAWRWSRGEVHITVKGVSNPYSYHWRALAERLGWPGGERSAASR